MRTRKIMVEVFENGRFHCKKAIHAPLAKDFELGWTIDMEELKPILQTEFPTLMDAKA